MIDPKNIKIAYIGGGSMGWARTLMKDLALEKELNGEVSLYDVDYTAAKMNEIIGLRMSLDERSLSRWSYKAVETLKEALTGSDFVIISILPGTLTHMYSDVHLPERLGIYQPVGDTAGPGGIIRALRTIPMYVEFANAIAEFAPNAWVINYTNPMSLCIRTLYKVFPEIKAFGCCHEVFGTQELVTHMIEEKTGIRPKRQDIKTEVVGVNHFTWLTKISYDGKDLYELFKEYGNRYYDTGYIPDGNSSPDNVFLCSNRVKFDLLKRYGVIAAAGDRHLAEFVPLDFYLKDQKTVDLWGFRLTGVNWRIADQQRKIEETKLIAEGSKDLEISPSGEEGVLLIKSLCGLVETVSNVILPNYRKQIEDFDEEAAVETNAVFKADKVVPQKTEKLPKEIYPLILPHIENQNRILDAALSYDKGMVYNAFINEPMLQNHLHTDLKLLADDMIKNTKDILPLQWK